MQRLPVASADVNGHGGGMSATARPSRGRSRRHASMPDACLAVAVATKVLRAPVPYEAWDCLRIVLLRQGAAHVYSAAGTGFARCGDVMILAEEVPGGLVPDGQVTVSVAYVDPTYFFQQMMWRHSELLYTPDVAETMLKVSFPVGQHRHLPPQRFEEFAWLFDRMEAAQNETKEPFFFVQSAFSCLLNLLSQEFPCAPVFDSELTTAPSLPKRLTRGPIRAEAIAISNAIRTDLASRWSTERMSNLVHLSTRQVSRIMVDAYGHPPREFVRTLRAKEMARLLRATNESIERIGTLVGWTSPSYARAAFQQVVGCSPAEAPRV